MLLQFLFQNLHFAIGVFSAMGMFWAFWLYFDVWTLKKTLKEFLKFSGFGMIAISFIVYSVMVEFSAASTFIANDVLLFLVVVIRFIGYLLLIFGFVSDPSLPKPNRNLGKGSALAAIFLFSFSGISFPSHIFSFTLPILCSILGLAVLYKATLGLEFHLKRLSLFFFILSVHEVLFLRNVFLGSSNVSLFELVAPFSLTWFLEHLTLFLGSLIVTLWLFSYLLRRLTTQIYIFLSLSVLVVFIFSTATFSYLLLNSMQKEALSQLETNSSVLEYSINSKKAETLSDVQLFSTDESVQEYIDDENYSKLANIASSFLNTKSLSFLVITDSNGKVIGRGEEVERIGDSLSGNDEVEQALLGESVTGIIYQEGVVAPDILVSAATPIFLKKEVIGVVYGGVLVDNSFVDGIHKATGLNSSIYGGNLISATTLTDNMGARRVGIGETNSEILETVLGTGNSYSGTTYIQNSPYFASYRPLKDINDSPVGMISVATPQIFVLSTVGKAIQGTLIVAGILWFLSIWPSYAIAVYIEKQLR